MKHWIKEWKVWATLIIVFVVFLIIISKSPETDEEKIKRVANETGIKVNLGDYCIALTEMTKTQFGRDWKFKYAYDNGHAYFFIYMPDETWRFTHLDEKKKILRTF